ncbi:gliding motility-associated peptidyl-prolyl isomerase GldI [Aureivirga sp. CE67]|uniref:gliding motility-associated peptidyl-prolyl isomerase GldI n=1 Tax=Aureivirga sp. CE67 TaxID=1788983 RepID=UPI0018CAA532|nr:gliding motility-associated peptidyl-prolyl isomerase GldI [Aureivirga sp. CE67]
MKNKYFFILILAFGFLSCSENTPRKPIQHRSGSYFKESVEISKKHNDIEETEIKRVIALDSLNNYEASTFGFWYYFDKKNEDNNASSPKATDIVDVNYEILNLYGEVIYKKEEIGDKKIIIDKEHEIQGLNEGLKLMKEGESVTFVFPSYMAYGLNLQQEDPRIGQKQPLIYKVELKSIIKNNQK